MNARLLLIATLTVGFTLGCMGGDTKVTEAPKPAPASDTPEQKAAKVAKAIAADASKADEALKEAGMSAEDFEALMYDIAKDPKRTEAYLEARK
ncbi:MAG: hypothetical protein H6737_18160 [Alphaproteobacteria bacterium]|nr:hypothetical protein [Phycisphaerales bacterium]MCB9677047.1 hypothetical protein [Alphaproteobacteria bacterium]